MIQINDALCIGCGACVRDCPDELMVLENGRAKWPGACMQCGHCAAVCPQGAITIPEYDMDDVEPCVPETVRPDPEQFLRMVKMRRSVRNFLPDPVTEEECRLITEAGRYTATGCNRQANRFIFVQENLEEFKELVWKSIIKKIADADAGKIPETDFVTGLRGFLKRYLAHPGDPYHDRMFKNAPAVLLVAAPGPVDGTLAAQNMEIEALTLGLGFMYNGYLVNACNEDPEIREWLGTADKPLQVSMLVGRPAVKYVRTAPRRAADVVIR